jgi:hypothetical protein
VNREVHYVLTKRWAMEAGFSEEDAEQVAAADVAVDALYPTREWRNIGYHFAWLGAHRRAKRLFRQAVSTGDLVALGRALHCKQDALAHGAIGHVWHWPGIDLWDRRSDRFREKLSAESRRLLEEYVHLRPTE